jgi:membrane-associated phospholipid phosphatase
VSDNTARHANRWGEVQDFFGGLGNPAHQLIAVSGMYVYSLARADVDAHELSQSLFNAVAISSGSTFLLKAAADTTPPNGESGGGWPSGHTASSVSVAAVLHEYYGPRVGVAAYLLAGLVAWERIDDREHDLSDVVFGAALGFVVGRTVAREHCMRFCGLEVEPFVDLQTGSSGIGLVKDF